jgi:hypothetical protein
MGSHGVETGERWALGVTWSYQSYPEERHAGVY